MGKKIRKIRPSDYWRIGEHESWFTDMAAEGLHLENMGLHFARFVKGEPKKMRYRIDVTFKEKIISEQKQIYAECGWDYVTSYGVFNVFSSPAELNAPELHTDPAEQSYTLKELDKKLAGSSLLVVVAVILSIAMNSATWFLGGTPLITLVDGRIVQQLFVIIIELYLIYTSLQATLSIRTLRKTLLDGKSIDHSAPWKRWKKRTDIIGIVFIVFAIVGVILPFMQIFMKETKTLPLTNTDLPVVRLADIENNPYLIRDSTSYIRDDVDWGNRYSYDWSLIAPVQYETDEQGVVPNEMWEDDSGSYSPSIHTKVYKLNFPSISENLIKDLIKRYSLEYRGGDFVEIEHRDFDILIIHEVDEYIEVFASKGKGVMYVRYHGYASLDSVLKNVAERIVLIAD